MNDNFAYAQDSREELIGGRLVAMSPAATNHNRIAGNIFYIFRHYLNGKKCVPFGDGETVYLTETNHYVPDFMVVCDRNKIKWNGVHGAPDLVVEILSPSTAKNDRGHKKAVYESSGVAEYWIVNPAGRSIEVYLLQEGRYVLDEVYTLYPDYELEAMKEEERAAVITAFRCHLYDDLDIRLDDVFSDLF